MLTAAPSPPPRSRPVAPLTVVLADGNTARGVQTRQYLTRIGYRVESGAGGVECLEILRRTPDPILVLDLDLMWGGADGLLSMAREDPRLRSIPAILAATLPSLTRQNLAAPRASPVRGHLLCALPGEPQSAATGE